jgi:hypothetical protein
MQARTVAADETTFHRLWPSTTAAAPWSGLVRQLYVHLTSLPVLRTHANGGRWLPAAEAVFPDDAVRHDAPLLAALLRDEMPVVHTPAPLCALLHLPLAARTDNRGAQAVTLVSPQLVRRWWQHGGGGGGTARKHPLTQATDAEARAGAMRVLSYCLEDLVDDDADSVMQLMGVALMPLADPRTRYTSLCLAGDAPAVFVVRDDERLLLDSPHTLR